jgi:hypothetical protein
LSTKIDHGESAYTNLNDWFEIVDGNIHVKGNRGLWSDSFISAGGLSDGGGSGGIDPDAMWGLLAAQTSEQIASTHLSNALNGYATQSWVQNQGYVTSSGITSVSKGTAVSSGAVVTNGSAVTIQFPTIPAALKNPYALTFGSKSYDGSSAVFLSASDIGALTGITSAMVTNALGYTPANSTALANYLPLTGGTLKNGANSNPLTLDTNGTTEVGMRFNMGGTNKGWVGYHSSNGVYLWSAASGKYLAIKDDGTPHLSNSTIWHAGNSNLSTVNWTANTMTANSFKLAAGTPTLTWDATNSAWHLTGNLYADGFISAGGMSSGGGSAGVDLAAVWNNLTTNTGEGLNKVIDTAHIPDMASTYGYLKSASLNGYATQTWVQNQGYLTAHQSLDGYVNALTRTPASGGNYVSAVTKSGKIITVTYATLPTSLPASDVYAWAKAATMPVATSSTVGGILLGYTQSGKNYPVQLSGNKAYVNVPWTDTTYSANNGVGLSGNTFYNSGVRSVEINGNYLRVNTNGTNADLTIPYATSVARATFGDASNGEHDANNIASNGLWYYTSNGPTTTLGASTNDGALYSQAYSTSWVVQIAQDYRNGRLFVRGKNNGTWQSWLKVYDSGNLTHSVITNLIGTTTYAPYNANGYLPLNGGTMSNTNVVTNLNADLLDGQHGSYYAAASALNNYLPLTGGTLKNGANSNPLTLDTNGTTEVGMRFNMGGTNKGWVGYHSSNGVYLWSAASGKYLAIKDDGTPHLSNSTIWHAGNSNLSTVPWACSTLTASGNATVGGTLGVTGAATLSSTLYVGGAISTGTSMTTPRIYLQRVDGLTQGRISFYSTSYYTWFEYMTNITTSPTGANEVAGAYVTTWARRSLIENNAGYGWVWESCANTANATPVIRMELSSNTGNLRVYGGIDSPSYISAGATSSSSDAKMKDNIRDFKYSPALLMAIKPREWDWNDKTPIDGHSAGFVAQEIQALLPYSVGKMNEYLTLNYNMFHALEVSALQNHETRLEALERENKELKDEIKRLKMNNYGME